MYIATYITVYTDGLTCRENSGVMPFICIGTYISQSTRTGSENTVNDTRTETDTGVEYVYSYIHHCIY